jgi:hypothetical protein
VNCLLKVLRGLQIEFTGGHWGFMVNTRVWLDGKDWSQSDGVAVFENSTPHIPSSELFALSLMHSLFINPQIQCDAADTLWQPSSLPWPGIFSTM